ncbi:phenylalanyl-tRNA synthetase beta chain [Halobacteriovorax marinus SJ]|uniref:Phenylalanine--tRNA ligase beta subunit n=1 Tax=Halobacteriovorax marinus (strain ATCC BAA-682 / DSM 15412 / SJ) TaxID=862908 RepID=E1X2F1_HALMS|nr:phenylalanine--tRNA ligase subunit beta [Halobacteriovorax marinus]CBW26718.1 phenylalanyl-tRNA synthetase beta chain [Halobacteriovorax marinus SJ]
MLISTDWIKDFVSIPEMSPKDLGVKFTLGTAEVEEVLVVGEHLEKIRVAEILEIEKHPEADKLNLVTFNFGDKENKRVVCGASNVKVGLKTAYAPLGVSLPNGLVLEPKKIRGVLSEGMLCSEEELGFAQDSAGIIELPSDAPIGQNMIDYYNETKDVILDVDNKSLTHRPDLWGHYGLAREFGAIFEQELKNPYNDSWANDLRAKFASGPSPITPKLEGESACKAYFGLSVDNVKVEESPNWMKKRLISVGLRPINNIVDISNYVMLELGMPLHIFDRDQIKDNQIIIKKLGTTAEFTTLDEEKRNLIESDTVICDADGPLVIGGLMGGLSSGVTDATTKVFIEVANWHASMVRSTSTRLGLRTDSSQRYEKTLDSKLCERTMLRTLDLILELCPEAKVVGKLEYDGDDLSAIEILELQTSFKKINKVLGLEVSNERILSIFNALDFKVTANGDDLSVTIPSYRSTKDIDCEADLIEEIGRIIGYDNIDPISPKLTIEPVRLTSAQALHRKLRDFLVYNMNSFEVNSYPLIGEKLLSKCSWPTQSGLNLLNSISKDHSIMRDSIVPNALAIAATNVKNYDDFSFFEIGRTYHLDKANFAAEKSELIIAMYSKESTPFMDLVNGTSRLLNASNIPFDLSERHPKFKNELISEEWVGVHPFEFYNIRIMGKMKGVITSIHPLILKQYKIKGHLSIAVVDLSQVESRPLKDKVKYRPLSKFPSSTFDCTVVTGEHTPVSEVLSSLKKIKIKELQSTKVVDIFTMDTKEKAITLRSVFMDEEKTLDGEFITQSSQKIVNELQKAGFPLKS